MYRLYFLVWPLVLVTEAWSSQWEAMDCPRECTCLQEDLLRKVYCDIQNQQQLKAIPSRFPADSQYISLKGNQISTIRARAFQYLRGLRHLDLASNELENLPQDAFYGLTSLETLNLSNNRLGQLHSQLLHGLNSLRDLYLDGNVIENLPKDFLQGLTSLRRLYLDSNKFYTLSHNLFGFPGANSNVNKERSVTPTIIGNLTSLVELLLNHNGIGQVQDDSFQKMPDLKRLKLNNNNITTLPRGIFRDLKSLRLLSLYNNPFQCTCSLRWLKNWISQNKNYITVFYPHLIKCDGPAKIRGKSMLRVKDSEFGCTEGDWSEWSSWSRCSKVCNKGRQHRTRRCTSGSTPCMGRSTQMRWCNMNNCDPGWSEWSVWTSCSVTCEVGYQTRSRSTQCTRSPCQRHLESEVRACPRKACPSYTEWSSWSMCGAVCGQGTQARTRQCASSHVGVPCLGSKVESQDCKIRDCAVWAAWGAWSECSKSCSQGEQTRKRDCVIVHGSKQQCLGNNTDIRDCSIKECPVDGGWSSWLPWSSCSKTCGLGFNKRHRRCSEPYPQHGGADCTGSPVEVTQCVMGLCADETTEFTAWSDWSTCSAQCGSGYQSRHRTCKKQDPVTGVKMCLGKSEEYRDCQGNQCERRWGEWTRWSKCYGDCIKGQSFRWRFCVNNHGRPGYTCKENKTSEIQRRSCKPSTCSYQPVWSAWSKWSACSRTCAGGTKRRWRYCVTRIIGRNCPGNHESKTSCNKHACPIHGGWSGWSEWGECDKKCGGGIKQRYRTCTEPAPKYNGCHCVGESKDKTICNTHKCNDPVQNDGLVVTKVAPEIMLVKPPKCPAPKIPTNGRYVIKTQKDNHKFLEYKCRDYYRNHGISTFRHCQSDGNWSGGPANCVLDCGEIKERLPERRAKTIKTIRNLTDFWPWQAAIEVPIRGINCGGTLIADQWVLTAAHCVLPLQSKENFKDIKVILGTYNLTDKRSKQVQVIPVIDTEHHKDYDRKSARSDIAILKLERKVHITKYVHPACLPKSRQRRQLIRAGQTGVMVGWGSQEPNMLRQIPLPVVKLQDCEESYKKNTYNVTKKMLCAGYKNKRHGTREKDSGGGFFFLHKKERRAHWVLGGIVSWRYPACTYCSKMGKYSVFTDVRKYMHWIKNMMDSL